MYASIAVAVLSILVALYAGLVALTASLDPGVIFDEQTRVIVEVDPLGFGEASGIRAGDTVVRLRRADEPGGWAVETSSSGGRLVGVESMEAALRASAVAALLATALGALALALAAARSSAEPSTGAAAGSLALSSIPLLVSFGPGVALVVPAIAAVAPWAWVAVWRRAERGWVPAVAGSVIGLAALVGLGIATLFEPLDHPRLALGAWIVASAIGLALAGARMTPARLGRGIGSISLLDAMVITSAVGAAIALVTLSVHPVLAVLVAALPLLVLARSRRRVAGLLDGLLLAEMRERESIRAMEEERARVSREIHDDPLQQIAGVLQVLEADGNTAQARESLREVASHLRVVATDLYPPVLDDLGLAPAIEAAVRALDDARITVAIDNQAGYQRIGRPPAEVELAAYRIVAEALANAVRHAGATSIVATGSVAANEVRLEVADDGGGLSPGAADEAMRAGHMGIVSMRRRAAAIGASLTVGPGPDAGTTVMIAWRA